MANQWLRLWHDMPTDPKWRTISKVSGQRIGDVIAVFNHLLVCASNATERGRTQSFNCEDVASALDLETEQVTAIIDAMQSRVLDGDRLKGWESRQVSREDGSAERAKAWREAQKAKNERTPNATERKQTPDKDTDTDKEIHTASAVDFDSFYSAYPKKVGKPAALKAWKAAKVKAGELVTILADLATRSQSTDWQKDGGQFIPNPSTYLNQRRWEDEQPSTAPSSSAFAGGF